MDGSFPIPEIESGRADAAFREEMDKRRIFRGQWGRMTVIDAQSDEVKKHVASKKTVAEIARDDRSGLTKELCVGKVGSAG